VQLSEFGELLNPSRQLKKNSGPRKHYQPGPLNEINEADAAPAQSAESCWERGGAVFHVFVFFVPPRNENRTKQLRAGLQETLL